MKKIAIALSSSLLLATATAQAISLSGETGDDYAGASAGFGLVVPGLVANVSYGHSKGNNDVYGFSLGYTLPLGAASLIVGGKALYLNQQHATDGYGVALGGGLQFPINRYFSFYGEGYYAPDAFSSHIDHYVEAKGGVRWQVLPLLNLDLSYRYINIRGESRRSDNKMADTFCLGAGFNF
ncbi:MAG: YfaZ family outer membrane protein [Symbiopectobacterium sp.]